MAIIDSAESKPELTFLVKKMKFENHKKNGIPKGFEQMMHKELTDPVVDDLIAVRESWDKEFEKKQTERLKKLAEAEKEGHLIFPKDK